ncbi:MAG: hypothetical protein IJD02_02535 [Lachnospiraceae bacterium]|nr:hypothetical protein [Lachnospiraceae bacterium]
MGLFDKKIKCSYCNKSVKEDYAINVGICPHCGKRLALPLSNPTFDNTIHSDSNYSNSSYSNNNHSNSYENTSTTGNTTRTFDTTCHHSDGTSHNTHNYNANRTSTVAPPSNNNSFSNTSSTHPQNNYQSNSGNNLGGTRRTIDRDYIRQVNAEANAQRNQNSSNMRNNRPTIYRNESNNKFAKIFLIVFVAIFVLSSVVPIIFGIIGMIFFTSSDTHETSTFDSLYYDGDDLSDIEDMRDDIENYVDHYYGNEGNSYTTDADGNTYIFPTSITMTYFLSQHFGKSVSELSYSDLCSIKGFATDIDYSTDEIHIYIYEDGGKSYTDFIENGFINTERLNNNCREYIFTANADTSSYQYISDLLTDIDCFPNLEYFCSNYSLSSGISFKNCENIEAFIVPQMTLYENVLYEPSIKYLSIYEIDYNEKKLNSFNNLTSARINSDFDVDEDDLTELISCPKLTSLYVKKEISNNTLAAMDNLVNIDICGISSLDKLECYNKLETLTLRFSSLSDLTPISRFEKLNTLSINDDTIVDYSILSSLSGLRSLTLAPLNHGETHKVSSLSSLTNLEHLDLDGIDDSTFIKSLANLKTLKLSHFYFDDIRGIVSSLPKLDTLSLEYVYEGNRFANWGYLSSLDNLYELNIKDCIILSDITQLFNTDSLMTLNIDNCTFYANGYKINNNDSLMYLSITNCSFSDFYVDANNNEHEQKYSIADLAAYMNCFEGLASLNMEGCGLSSEPNVADGVYVTY